jgi:hypothetical protein
MPSVELVTGTRLPARRGVQRALTSAAGRLVPGITAMRCPWIRLFVAFLRADQTHRRRQKSGREVDSDP